MQDVEIYLHYIGKFVVPKVSVELSEEEKLAEAKRQERINLWKGKAASHTFPVVEDSIRFNAFQEVLALQIPVYFFAGTYDYTCCYKLQYQYYEQVHAPVKEFYVFENSVDSPIYEETEKVEKIIDEILSLP